MAMVWPPGNSGIMTLILVLGPQVCRHRPSTLLPSDGQKLGEERERGIPNPQKVVTIIHTCWNCEVRVLLDRVSVKGQMMRWPPGLPRSAKIEEHQALSQSWKGYCLR